IFDISAMQQVQAEQDIASSGTNGHGRPMPAPAESEWYVAINDEQVGPLSFEEVRERWDKEEVNPGSLAWKAGMGDWSPIRTIKELEALGDMDDRARTVVARIEANED